MKLEAFIKLLNAEEKSRYDEIVVACGRSETDHKALQKDFQHFAIQVHARLSLEDNPAKFWGPLWGEVKRAHQPKKVDASAQPLPELAARLPYPLGLKVRQNIEERNLREAGEPVPQYAFNLCATMGILVRLAAMLTIQSYVVRTGAKNAELNKMIVDTLRAPADGGWLAVAQRLSKALEKRDDAPVAKAVASGLNKSVKLQDKTLAKRAKGANKPNQALQELVSFRNRLAHGERISEEELLRAEALLEVAARGFGFLADWQLVVRHEDRAWELAGTMPFPLESSPEELKEAEPTLMLRAKNDVRLSLSPLLRFRPDAGEEGAGEVELDELFFLNAGSLQRLSYIGYRGAAHADGRSLGSYEAFKEFLGQIPTPPVPANPRLDFSPFYEYHNRLFVGRTEVLEEVASRVADRETGYQVLKALAGMGKSAIMAQLYGKHSVPAAETRAGDRWAFHFCMPTDGRNSSVVALRSIIAQICDHFGLDREPHLSQDIEELKDEKLPGILALAKQHLGEGERVVIAVDALDEGIGAEKESIPKVLPTFVPDHAVFVVSYRVDDSGENSRVEAHLAHISADNRQVLEHANPLRGLSRANVEEFLTKAASGGVQATEATREAVWTASIADTRDMADPFYLRFVAEGIDSAQVRLDRAETIPASLDDAFEGMWMTLPTDQDFLVHRMLLTLGIMREMGDDELFAALFNRERTRDQQLVPDDIGVLRVQAGKLLVYDGDRYGLFHDRFRRFLVGEQKDPIAEALGVA
jgi:hypothetical protein